MKITHLPHDPGPTGWNAILPPLPPAQVLQDRLTADWLVIGGGFAGLAAARRLRELHPTDRIVLLEACRIGEGPAGRNSGFMIDLPHDLASEDYGGAIEADRAQTQANRAGIDFAAQMATDYKLGTEAFDRAGKYNAAATEKGHTHNLKYARHLSDMGEPSEMFDAAQMREVTGSDYYQSGLYTPGTAMIQPALFVRGVAAGLASGEAQGQPYNPVQIFEASPVISLTHKSDWIATTPQGQITSPRVILGVNGHINSFGHFKGQLLHIFTYASMTRPLTEAEVKSLGGVPKWGATPADPMGTTVRRISGTGGDRIVIRNRFTCNPSMQASDAALARICAGHDTAFAARFPTLPDVTMQYRWGGRLCLSRNNVAALGQIDEGLFSACCQNGLGTAKGTLHGKLMAELASHYNSALLDTALAAPAPVKLPPTPLTWLGANATIRWQEYKADKEL